MVHYHAIAERFATDRSFSITFPDFPEVASASSNVEGLRAIAQDALATVITLYIEEGKPLPTPTPLNQMPRRSPGSVWWAPIANVAADGTAGAAS